MDWKYKFGIDQQSGGHRILRDVFEIAHKEEIEWKKHGDKDRACETSACYRIDQSRGASPPKKDLAGIGKEVDENQKRVVTALTKEGGQKEEEVNTIMCYRHV